MGKKVNKIHSPSFLLFQPAFCLFPHCGVELKSFASFLYPCTQMLMKKISHKFYQGALTWIISVISASISLGLQKFGPTFSSFNPCPFLPTLGARGFSCAVSGFSQVLKSDPRFARVFGLWPNTCRLAAYQTKLPVAREKKPLVPRVILTIQSIHLELIFARYNAASLSEPLPYYSLFCGQL